MVDLTSLYRKFDPNVMSFHLNCFGDATICFSHPYEVLTLPFHKADDWIKSRREWLPDDDTFEDAT